MMVRLGCGGEIGCGGTKLVRRGNGRRSILGHMMQSWAWSSLIFLAHFGKKMGVVSSRDDSPDGLARPLATTLYLFPYHARVNLPMDFTGFPWLLFTNRIRQGGISGSSGPFVAQLRDGEMEIEGRVKCAVAGSRWLKRRRHVSIQNGKSWQGPDPEGRQSCSCDTTTPTPQCSESGCEVGRGTNQCAAAGR